MLNLILLTGIIVMSVVAVLVTMKNEKMEKELEELRG